MLNSNSCLITYFGYSKTYKKKWRLPVSDDPCTPVDIPPLPDGPLGLPPEGKSFEGLFPPPGVLPSGHAGLKERS